MSPAFIFDLPAWALLAQGVALVTMLMFPKRLLALTLFAALAVMPPCALHAQFNSDSCGCPIPVGDTGLGFGIRLPEYYDGTDENSPMISPGGSKLMAIMNDEV